MSLKTARVRQRLFSISPDETTFARRGFRRDKTGAVSHLEMLDRLMPWNKCRLQSFLSGEGAAHVYTINVGAGWAFARLPWLRRVPSRGLDKFDPLLRWLVVNGFGFHEGYFHCGDYVRRGQKPRHLSGYGPRAFGQGLGRSLWFVEGAVVAALPSTIAAFEAPRRKDLWSGVGLACAYAGGVNAEEMESLKASAPPARTCLLPAPMPGELRDALRDYAENVPVKR